MLAQGIVNEVERLLAEGKLSQRKIAQALGVSRGTVGAIASGKRPDYEKLRLQRGEEIEPEGPIERCPSCGGRVYMPCRLCRIRRFEAGEEERLRMLRRKSGQRSVRRLLAAVLRQHATEEPTDIEVQQIEQPAAEPAA